MQVSQAVWVPQQGQIQKKYGGQDFNEYLLNLLYGTNTLKIVLILTNVSIDIKVKAA